MFHKILPGKRRVEPIILFAIDRKKNKRNKPNNTGSDS